MLSSNRLELYASYMRVQRSLCFNCCDGQFMSWSNIQVHYLFGNGQNSLPSFPSNHFAEPTYQMLVCSRPWNIYLWILSNSNQLIIYLPFKTKIGFVFGAVSLTYILLVCNMYKYKAIPRQINTIPTMRGLHRQSRSLKRTIKKNHCINCFWERFPVACCQIQ